jgi:hypothetical protein
MGHGKRIKLVLLLTVFVLSAASAAATFISPGKYMIEFQPNLEQDLIFYVGGADSIDVIVDQGGLGQYLKVVEVSDIPPGEPIQGKMFVVHMKLPEWIDSPGLNDVRVIAQEKAANGQGTIGTAVSVIAMVFINVPYPGVYVTTKFGVANYNENETVDLALEAFERGWENISNTWAEFDVLDNKNNTLKTMKTESAPLFSRKPQGFYAKWNSTGYPAGDYNARARFYYLGNISRKAAPFKIGQLVVHVLNYTRTAKFQSISPFDIIVQSGWNSAISNVYAVVTINHTVFQTPTVSLNPWETQTLKGFFDTTGVNPGKHPVDIVLYYQGSGSSFQGEVQVMGPPKKSMLEQPMLLYGGLAVIVLLLLVLLLVLLLFLRRKQPER